MKRLLFLAVLALAIPCLAADGNSLDRPTPLLDLLIQPTRTPPPVAFDANSGSYTRKVDVPVWLWNDPSKAVSGIEAFKGRDSTSPSFSGTAYTVGEGSGGTFAGGSIADWKDTVRRGPIVLCIFGGLMLAAGIVLAIWAKQVLLGIAIALAGLALVVTGVLFEAYPWIAIIALVLMLGVGLWWLWSSKSLVAAKANLTATVDKIGTALGAVVQGVQAAPAAAQTAVKTKIADAATATGDPLGVKTTITAVKNGASVKGKARK
jgi:hypothetical protein